MAKGGGSANKSFLYQETKAVLNPERMLALPRREAARPRHAACPPYHLAIVVGGTSAEYALKTAKYASAKYLDALPTTGSPTAHGFRDLELEAQVLELTRGFGIGAQFGGKYFCHDVRVVRLPRHGASCPVAIAVSCSADRQALGKITAEGVFLEQLETDPARFLPDVTDEHLEDTDAVVRIDLNRPMDEIRATLTTLPVKTRLSLSGPLVVARDIAHAKIKERLDAGEPMPSYLRDHAVYYAGPAKTPEGYASGSFGPTTAGRMDSYVAQFQAAGGSFVMLAKGNRSAQVTDACQTYGGFYLGLDRRPGRPAGAGLHQERRGRGVRRARHGGGLEDRGRGLPGVRRRRRQGQRLLRRDRPAGGAHHRPRPGCLTGWRRDRAAAGRAARRRRSANRCGSATLGDGRSRRRRRRRRGGSCRPGRRRRRARPDPSHVAPSPLRVADAAGCPPTRSTCSRRCRQPGPFGIQAVCARDRSPRSGSPSSSTCPTGAWTGSTVLDVTAALPIGGPTLTARDGCRPSRAAPRQPAGAGHC